MTSIFRRVGTRASLYAASTSPPSSTLYLTHISTTSYLTHLPTIRNALEICDASGLGLWWLGSTHNASCHTQDKGPSVSKWPQAHIGNTPTRRRSSFLLVAFNRILASFQRPRPAGGKVDWSSHLRPLKRRYGAASSFPCWLSSIEAVLALSRASQRTAELAPRRP